MGFDLRFVDGVILHADHFRPEIASMLYWAAKESPPTDDGIVWVTSAWRVEGDTPSYHPLDCAFDFRVSNIVARDWAQREQIAKEWAGRCRLHLPTPHYDWIVHDVGQGLHLHSERNGERPR